MTAYVDHNNKNCDLGILVWEKGKNFGNIAWKMAIKKIFNNSNIKNNSRRYGKQHCND